jgi:ribosomal protein S18 acetylase RimI-like enzyme
VILDRATPDDAQAIATILGDWIAATDWMPKLHTRAQDLGFARHLLATQQVWVIRAPTVRGYLALDGTVVTSVTIAAKARGRGTGKLLLDHAKTVSPRLTLFTFQANTRALRFYEREGFAELRRTDGADNEEHLPDVELGWGSVS